MADRLRRHEQREREIAQESEAHYRRVAATLRRDFAGAFEEACIHEAGHGVAATVLDIPIEYVGFEPRGSSDTVQPRCVLVSGTIDPRFWLAGLAADQLAGNRGDLNTLSSLDRLGLQRCGITSYAAEVRELERTYRWLSRDMRFVHAVADSLQVEGRLSGNRVWQIVHAGWFMASLFGERFGGY